MSKETRDVKSDRWVKVSYHRCQRNTIKLVLRQVQSRNAGICVMLRNCGPNARRNRGYHNIGHIRYLARQENKGRQPSVVISEP